MRQSLWRLKTAAVAFAMIVLVLLAGAPRSASAATAALFGRERLYSLGAADVAAIKSTYSTVILFVVDVGSNGDLNYNGNHVIVQNGVYVGDANWGARLAGLKTAPTTVNRIEVCTGGAGAQSWNNIKNLIASQGTGSGSILYRNFLALKNALGIDAIDNDDEVAYDAASAATFNRMISSIGMKNTLCPYNNSGYWQSVYNNSTIDAVYLQCYDGGGGNNPSSWNSLFGSLKVIPGNWYNDSLATFQSKMANWASTSGATGGFYWLLDDRDAATTKQYGDAINAGIGGPLPQPYFMLVNQGSGKCLDLINGNTANGAVTNQWSYDYNGANQRWALLPTENADHFKIVSWVSGKAVSVSNDSTANSAQLWAWDYTGNNPSQQWDLVDAGNGWYNLRNVRSGLLMDVSGSSTADNAKIQQYANTNSGAQRWRLQPWGNYYIRTNTGVGNYICIQGQGSTNGSPIIQYSFEPNNWFKWKFTSEGDGFYGLFSLNAPTRVLSVVNGSSAAAANTHLWDYNVNNVGDQKIRILPKTNGRYKFFFKHDGMSWDIPGGNGNVNTSLQQYPDNGFGWQEFKLERIP
ncbi:MAG: putative secreted protein [Capsulimonas sp.]|nr:putative secreted protein [Capsulimonas sp.]